MADLPLVSEINVKRMGRRRTGGSAESSLRTLRQTPGFAWVVAPLAEHNPAAQASQPVLVVGAVDQRAVVVGDCGDGLVHGSEVRRHALSIPLRFAGGSGCSADALDLQRRIQDCPVRPVVAGPESSALRGWASTAWVLRDGQITVPSDGCGCIHGCGDHGVERGLPSGPHPMGDGDHGSGTGAGRAEAAENARDNRCY